MPKIRRIERTLPQIMLRKKVAAYARVSENTEQLMHSLSAQISYYSSLIQKNPEWEYVGVYADEGITGTSTKHRTEFKRLVEDCTAGKIDMVLVKSISRFARDTVDTLETTRYLKSIGIDVFFEREHIHSMSDDGEFLLTLLASFAQEESRSISENIKWSVRKKFQQGIPNGHKAPFGYEWDGEMFRIIPDQGRVVKIIYRRYLRGESAYGIAKALAEDGVKGQMGVPIEESTVKNILSSHSYMGSMILQKHYFTEEHTRKKNHGELPRFVVEDMFEPLVSEQEFEKAQEIMQIRAEQRPNKNPKLTAFSGKVRCGDCGCSVSRRTAPKGKKWVCNTRERKGMDKCGMRPLYETELMGAATKALGLTEFDESSVKAGVEQITIKGDAIEFALADGKVKKVKRKYGGHKMRSGFSGKLICGCCGEKYQADTWKIGPVGKKVKHKVWQCATPRHSCSSKRLMEDELRKATEHFLGSDYEALFVEQMEKTVIYDDRLEFNFKDGTVRIWQRE